MSSCFDVIVAGVGAMGAATCSALARRGVRVLGLERFDIPHALGSSGGHVRLIRKAYYEHPDYVPLLELAYRQWRALELRTRSSLLFPTGLVHAGRPDGELIAGVRRAASRHGLGIAALDAQELAARMPPLQLPEGYVAIFEADGGFVLAERSIVAFAQDALAHGAELHAQERIVHFEARERGVRVVTERGAYDAARLVITAGPHAPRFLADLGVALRVTRQVVGWVRPLREAPFAYGAFPCYAIEGDPAEGGGLHYGFPALPASFGAGPPALKVGHHALGPLTDPELLDRGLAAGDESGFRAGLARHLPDANGPLLAAHASIALASGFSGHGFKFAPVIGEALADLALEGRSALPIGFLSLARFERP
jgi:sarcosine oxidase